MLKNKNWLEAFREFANTKLYTNYFQVPESKLLTDELIKSKILKLFSVLEIDVFKEFWPWWEKYEKYISEIFGNQLKWKEYWPKDVNHIHEINACKWPINLWMKSDYLVANLLSHNRYQLYCNPFHESELKKHIGYFPQWFNLVEAGVFEEYDLWKPLIESDVLSDFWRNSNLCEIEKRIRELYLPSNKFLHISLGWTMSNLEFDKKLWDYANTIWSENESHLLFTYWNYIEDWNIEEFEMKLLAAYWDYSEEKDFSNPYQSKESFEAISDMILWAASHQWYDTTRIKPKIKWVRPSSHWPWFIIAWFEEKRGRSNSIIEYNELYSRKWEPTFKPLAYSKKYTDWEICKIISDFWWSVELLEKRDWVSLCVAKLERDEKLTEDSDLVRNFIKFQSWLIISNIKKYWFDINKD